jgi:hypothetical protein
MDGIQYHQQFQDGGLDTAATPGEVPLGRKPEATGVEGWLAFAEPARNCESTAYDDLYRRLKCFRKYFGRHIFGDPETAYCDFVRDLVDQIRYGFLQSPQCLVAQARLIVLRRTADRIGRLTTAAQILSTIPKREREVFIRSQLALQPTGAGRQAAQGKANAAGELPPRKGPPSYPLRGAIRRNERGGIHCLGQGSWREQADVPKTA